MMWTARLSIPCLLCLFQGQVLALRNRRIDKIDGTPPHKGYNSNLYLWRYFRHFQGFLCRSVYSVYLSIPRHLSEVIAHPRNGVWHSLSFLAAMRARNGVRAYV